MEPTQSETANYTRPAPVKLIDVARAAGVSLATASRALSSPELVRERTRERVRTAVTKLGYVPHGAARALASHRTRTIGAIFPPLENPIFASGTHALNQELTEAGYTLLLASHDNDSLAELQAARRLIERGVDGLVLVGMQHEPELYELLAHTGIPYEMTWAIDHDRRSNSVGVDHRAAGALLTRYLIFLGHREFAVIAGDTERNDRALLRLSGVHDALAEFDIRLAHERVVQTEFSVASGRLAMARLLDHAPGFTAVIGGNDPQAIGALFECGWRGIEVPKDLSIIGFDDIELAGELNPGLTTVRMPSNSIGRVAGQRLLARLAGDSVPRTHVMATHLVVRQTTAAPRQV